MAGDGAVDDIIEVRADFIGAAALPGVTAHTLLENSLALRSIGTGQKRRNRRCHSGGLSASAIGTACLCNNGETFLFGCRCVENTFRRYRYRHKDEYRAQKGSDRHVYI